MDLKWEEMQWAAENPSFRTDAGMGLKSIQKVIMSFQLCPLLGLSILLQAHCIKKQRQNFMKIHLDYCMSRVMSRRGVLGPLKSAQWEVGPQFEKTVWWLFLNFLLWMKPTWSTVSFLRFICRTYCKCGSAKWPWQQAVFTSSSE